MQHAKHPDEYLKKFGADKFKNLLNESSSRVEYQLNAIRRKYDLAVDEQRVKFIAEAAEFVSTLSNAVQREIYGTRAAEAAGISFEAMKIEANKAYKRRIAREKKKQERRDLSPATQLQPKTRAIRYDNMKSAMAEETVLALVMKAPALLDQTGELTGSEFSCPVLGRAFDQLRKRHGEGFEVNLSGLSDFTAEEMSHIAGIVQRQQGPVNEQALSDCVRTIRTEHRKGRLSSEEDLLAYQNKLKERKGIKA